MVQLMILTGNTPKQYRETSDIQKTPYEQAPGDIYAMHFQLKSNEIHILNISQ